MGCDAFVGGFGGFDGFLWLPPDCGAACLALACMHGSQRFPGLPAAANSGSSPVPGLMAGAQLCVVPVLPSAVLKHVDLPDAPSHFVSLFRSPQPSPDSSKLSWFEIRRAVRRFCPRQPAFASVGWSTLPLLRPDLHSVPPMLACDDAEKCPPRTEQPGPSAIAPTASRRGWSTGPPAVVFEAECGIPLCADSGCVFFYAELQSCPWLILFFLSFSFFSFRLFFPPGFYPTANKHPVAGWIGLRWTRRRISTPRVSPDANALRRPGTSIRRRPSTFT